jgi:hypothetical protein
MAYAGPIPFPVLEGGTGDASFTAYSVLTGGTTSTGALQNVSGVGSSGQVLTSNGAAALPSWQTGTGGNLVLISSQTASSSANISFTSGITGTYNNYYLLYSNVFPVTNGVTLQLTVSTNGGSSYVSTGYNSWLGNANMTNTAGYAFVDTTSGVILHINQGDTANTSNPINGYCNLMNVTAGTYFMSTNGTSTGYNTATPNVFVTTHAAMTNQAAVNAIRLSFQSGNIAQGTFTLYGVLE